MKDILKANILSLICAVIVIIALIVPIWPMGGYKKDLEARLQERATVYTSLVSLRTKQRNLPAIDPDGAANPVPLDGFPNENIIAKADEVKKTFQDQSTRLVTEAINLNRHAPLVPRALPMPANNAIAIDFRDQYRALILTYIPQNPVPGAPGSSIILGGIAQRWKVGLPPSTADLTAAVQKLWQSKYQPQLGGAPTAAGTATGARQVLMNQYNDEAALIPAQERTKVAMNSLIYMNPDALPYITSFNNKEAPQPLDIWNAQLQLWIIDDVGHGIMDANAGAKNVTEAAIKHLIKIALPYPQPYIVMAGQTMDGELAGPAPKVLDLGATASPSPVPMTTGRVSNPLYDVVQFDIVMNVDAAQIPHVLSSLSHNRFLTVLTATVTAVDSDALAQQGYMYGGKPVVQLSLHCEDVFFHKWERELMPKVMSDAMAGVQPATGGEGNTY